MKKILTLIAAVILMTGYSQAQQQTYEINGQTYRLVPDAPAEENNAKVNSFLDGLEFGGFSYILTDDFKDDEELGGGARLNYYIVDSLGIGTEVFIDKWNEGVFFDRQSFNVLFKASLDDDDKFAFVPFGGVVRNYEDDIWGFNVGLRSNIAVTDNVYIDLGGRWLKEDDRDSAALFDAGLGFRF